MITTRPKTNFDSGPLTPAIEPSRTHTQAPGRQGERRGGPYFSILSLHYVIPETPYPPTTPNLAADGTGMLKMHELGTKRRRRGAQLSDFVYGRLNCRPTCTAYTDFKRFKGREASLFFSQGFGFFGASGPYLSFGFCHPEDRYER